MFCKDCFRDVVAVEDAPWFNLEGWYLRCNIKEIYDGDTVTVIFPFNGRPYKTKCRLAGIDAPEIRTKDEFEKKRGLQARDWLRDRIQGKIVWIRFGKNDKYGRTLGEIYLSKDGKTSVNQIMIEQKLACIYNGKIKPKFGDWCDK